MQRTTANDSDKAVGTQEQASLKETVLLTDNREIRNLLSNGLERQGYTVYAAADGLQSLRLAERHLDELDALITDIDMPHLCGTEVALQLMVLRPQLKILFTSGSDRSVFDATHVLVPGMVFVEKPFTVGELGRKLRETLDSPALTLQA
jgi:DNA-binding response OmpR family regulator